MTNSEHLLRSILGPVRSDLRPLTFAVDITRDLLFAQHFSMDDILVTKLIYTPAANLLCRTPRTVARRIERLSHLCWDAMVEQELVLHYIGRSLKQAPTPASVVMYLAVYAQLRKPFFYVVETNPQLLFQTPETASAKRPTA